MSKRLKGRLTSAVSIAAAVVLITTTPSFGVDDSDSAFADAPTTLLHIVSNDPSWAETYGESPDFSLGTHFDLNTVRASGLITPSERGLSVPVTSALETDAIRCAVVLVDGAPTDSLYCVAPHPVSGVPTFLSLRELGDFSDSVASTPGEIVDLSPFGLVELRGDTFVPLEDAATYHLGGGQPAAVVLNAIGTLLAENSRLAIRGDDPLAGSAERLISSPPLSRDQTLASLTGAEFAPLLVSAELWSAVSLAGGVPEVQSATTSDRELYVVSAGSLVKTNETCVASATSLSCHDGATETLQTDDMGWASFPLPEGALVDATPHGWWVVQDQVATPLDNVAMQSSPTPVSVDELISLASAGGSSWPPGLLGVGWGYVFGFLAALALAAGAVWLIVRRRRARHFSSADA